MATKHSIRHKGIPYPVIVYEDETKGYWVQCPAFEGCYSQGDTIDEALENVKEAIALCLEEAPAHARQLLTPNMSLHLVRV